MVAPGDPFGLIPANSTIPGISGTEFRRAPLSLTRVTEPEIEPLRLDDAKNFCRIDTTDDDGLVQGLIESARDLAERECGVSILKQTWELRLDWFPTDESPIELPRSPLIAVGSVKYIDQAGTLQTYASTNYFADLWSKPGRVCLNVGSIWPRFLRPGAAVVVTYDAGYGTSADKVPRGLRSALLQLVAYLYENREGVDQDAQSVEWPVSLKRLFAPYKIVYRI